MGKTPTSGRRFQFRNGASSGGDVFYWKGVATKPDLGAQPSDRPRRVINGRYVGGHIVARPPITDPVANIPGTTWRPSFSAEHHSYGGIRLWWVSTIAESSSSTADGFAIGFVDSDFDPTFIECGKYYRAPHPTGLDQSPGVVAPISSGLARFAQFIFVGDYGALRRLYRFNYLPGSRLRVIAKPSPTQMTSDEVVAVHPEAYVCGLHVHDGKLYYGTIDPNNVNLAAIWVWDGLKTTKIRDLTVTARYGLSITTYKNTLVVCANGLDKLQVMAPDGTWTEPTVAGFTASKYSPNMAEVAGVLYIASGATKIYSWDGSTLAEARVLSNGTSPVVTCCIPFNGRLYYGWSESFGGGNYYSWIGTMDPATADASYKWWEDHIALDFPINTITIGAPGTDPHYILNPATMHTTGIGPVMSMAVYRGRIVVTAGSDSLSYVVTHEEANNPKSAWVMCHSNNLLIAPRGPLSFDQIDSDGNSNLVRSFRYLKVM